MLEFRILGPLEISRDGAAIEVGAQRQRAVLALLLLNANHVVPTERLVDEVWGENPPKTARTALHNALVHLRKLLGSDALERRPPGYLLRVDPDHFDLARFERLVVRAREAPAEERAELLREALAEWRGAPPPGVAHESFAHPHGRPPGGIPIPALA